MIIVQLSDLHVGSQFLQEKFETLLEEVNQLQPDVIVVTGDLTNEGLMKEYEKIKTLLSKFNTKKILSISGNHDYRNTGYLLFKKYFPFETVNELDDDAWPKSLLCLCIFSWFAPTTNFVYIQLHLRFYQVLKFQ
jgi:3',5'-cyclic AMP phosphodiesterase CpdA